VVAIDALDELRDPDSAATPLISDFLPPAERLPDGCTVLLTARDELRPRVRSRLEELRQGGGFTELPLRPEAAGSRELARAYLRDRLPERLRGDGPVEEVLRRSGGVFLYAFHFTRALAAGVFAEAPELPDGEQFYRVYLARLRERVGSSMYEAVYRPTLLLL